MRHALRWLAGVACVVACAAVGQPAHAHGGAYDMRYVDGSNVLLLTFNTHAPVSGLEIEHDLRLYDLLGAPIPYDEVAVEVHARDKDQTATLRGQTLLHEETAPMLPTNESKLTYAYPVRGGYTLDVTFRAGGRPVSHGAFAIDVAQGTAGPGGFPWKRLALTLLVGIAIGVLLPRSPRVVEPPADSRPEATDPIHAVAPRPRAGEEATVGSG